MNALLSVLLGVAAAGAPPSHLHLPREVQRGDQTCIQRLDEDGALVERCPDGRRYEVLPAFMGRRLRAPEPVKSIRRGGSVRYGHAGIVEVDVALRWQNYLVEDAPRSYTRAGAAVRVGGFPMTDWRVAATLGFDHAGESGRRPSTNLSAGLELTRLLGAPGPVGVARPFFGVRSGVGLTRRATLAGVGVLGGLRMPVAPAWGIDVRVQALRQISETGGWDLGAYASVFLFLPTAGGGS